jgi:DNA-binding transcriptional LysR family regulator
VSPSKSGLTSTHRILEYSDDFRPAAEAQWLRRYAKDARIVLRANATLALHQAALSGLGMALLPCYLAESIPGLVRVLPKAPKLMRELWLAAHRDLRHTGRVRAVSEELAQLVFENRAVLAGGMR